MKDKALVARYSQRGCRAATCACEPEALCMDESRTKLHTYLEAGVIRDTQRDHDALAGHALPSVSTAPFAPPCLTSFCARASCCPMLLRSPMPLLVPPLKQCGQAGSLSRLMLCHASKLACPSPPAHAGACKDRAVTKVAAHFRHTLMRLSMLCNTLTGLPVKGSGSTVKPVNKAAMGNLVPTPVHTGLGAKAPHRFGSVSAVSS
eukprot:1156925-Pelagomonas_calceolata.AAC.3